MKTTRQFWWPLIVLILLGLPLTVFAQAGEPGGGLNGVIDPFTPKYIDDPISRNAGELEGWRDIASHPSLGGALSASWRRTHDAKGIAIAPGMDTYAGNNQTVTFGTWLIRGPSDTPAGPGCKTDSERAMGINRADFGEPSSFNWEAMLMQKVADPGRYQITWTKGAYSNGTIAVPYEFARNYNPFPPDYHVIVKVRDSVTGGTIPGAQWSIVKPYTDGPYYTDTTGQNIVDLAPQLYLVNISATGYKALSNHPLKVADNPNRSDLPHWNITLIPNSSPDQYMNSGTMRVIVNDAVDSRHLTYADDQAKVNINGTWHNCDANGEVFVSNLITGQYYTVAATATGHVAQTQNIQAGTQGNYEFRLARATGTGGDGDGGTDDGDGDGGVDQGLMESWFVPSQSVLQKWGDLIDLVKGWGPVGVMVALHEAWDSGQRAGAHELCWAFTIPILGDYGPPVQWCIDLRPEITSGGPYADGSNGSKSGTYMARFRLVLGWLVWVMFLWFLVAIVRPRMST